jgi:hypothetical protein
VTVVAILDVRRLAAADMWGTAGTMRRRRLIRAEFAVGAIGCTLLGVLVLASAGSLGWALVGAWLVGAGINYVPLALYARSLSRPGRLEAELRDVDLRRELRRTGLRQFWIAVPLAVAIAALASAWPRRS